mgnify:CR=1 FL=1
MLGKQKTIKDLHDRLKQEGIEGYGTVHNFRDKWLIPRERGGSFCCRWDEKHKYYRTFTQEDIEEIVVAFKDGGPQKWSYII